MTLIASKIFLWMSDGSILDSFFSGRISSVQWLVNRLLLTVAVVACAMRRLQILFPVALYLAPSWSFRGSGEPGVRPSTISLGSTYVKLVF